MTRPTAARRPRRLRLYTALFAALLTVTGAMALVGLADAEPLDAACALPETQLDKYRYLRSLSLDLRGRLPTPEEMARLDGVDDVPEAMIDEMLATDAFAERVVRWHRLLLWNNISNQRLFNTRARIRKTGTDLWYRSGAVAVMYRGLSKPCNDEPAVADGSGGFVQTQHADGSMREGYVMVEPYWAPGTQIKVCGYDSIDLLSAPDGTACDTADGLRHTDCGCGPNLRWCAPSEHEDQLLESMGRDIDLRVRQIVLDDRPYTDLFTEDLAYVDGPLVHYWRHQTDVPRLDNRPLPVPVDALPDLAYDAMEPVAVNLAPEHAGVLTSPGFLLRFQTDRGRANRFYDAFLCQPFQPPDGPLPVADVRAQAEPDLQERDGCKYCHALLEPAASYWGRWTQQGAGFLDPDLYPAQSEECARCAEDGLSCASVCRRNYLTRAEDPELNPYLGWLQAYSFRRPEHFDNVEEGPQLLISETLADGRLVECTARRASEALFGRELAGEELELLDDVMADFVHGSYSYRELVKSIVTSPTYRRVR